MIGRNTKNALGCAQDNTFPHIFLKVDSIGAHLDNCTVLYKYIVYQDNKLLEIEK